MYVENRHKQILFYMTRTMVPIDMFIEIKKLQENTET